MDNYLKTPFFWVFWKDSWQERFILLSAVFKLMERRQAAYYLKGLLNMQAVVTRMDRH